MVAEDDDVATERAPLFSFPTRPLSLRCNFSKARASRETIRINLTTNGNNNAYPKEEITDNYRVVEIPLITFLPLANSLICRNQFVRDVLIFVARIIYGVPRNKGVPRECKRPVESSRIGLM